MAIHNHKGIGITLALLGFFLNLVTRAVAHNSIPASIAEGPDLLLIFLGIVGFTLWMVGFYFLVLSYRLPAVFLALGLLSLLGWLILHIVGVQHVKTTRHAGKKPRPYRGDPDSLY